MSEDCGKPGTIFNWDDFSSGRDQALTFHGRAKSRPLLQIDGPCNMQSQVLVFTKEYTSFSDCMEHCKKLGTQCPSVKTREELDMLKDDLQANFPLLLDHFSYSEASLWLAVTQGHMVNTQLSNFDHWPEGVEAREGVWREYYTGEQLGD